MSKNFQIMYTTYTMYTKLKAGLFDRLIMVVVDFGHFGDINEMIIDRMGTVEAGYFGFFNDCLKIVGSG